MSLRQLFTEIEQDEWVNIPQGWLQGRTIYGGLVAGMMMQKALVTIADPAKRLLSSSVTFVGPVQENQARLTAEILRQGKSVTTIEVRLWQDDAVQSILIASFGMQRESSIQVQQERIAPDYPIPERLAKLPQRAAMPQCYQQFDVCWAEGNYPCTGSAKPDFGGWFRFNPAQHENHELTVAELMTLLDIWPPGVLCFKP